MTMRLAAAAITALTVSCGCATMAHGPRQEVVITSEPPGAIVFINDVPAGSTPARIRVARIRSRVVVRVEKPGFATERVALKRSVSGWVLLDALLPLNPLADQGLDSPSDRPRMIVTSLAIMLGMDLVTGAAFNLPKVVRIVLKPQPLASPCGRSPFSVRRIAPAAATSHPCATRSTRRADRPASGRSSPLRTAVPATAP